MLIERTQMSPELSYKVKLYIRRQREKRKQEQEQDAAIARHKREAEARRREQATTLEEIKEQLVVLERRLTDLKAEKHQLFLQLKKVLNEDETRRRARESELVNVHQHFMAAPYSYLPPTVYASGPGAAALRPTPLYHKMTIQPPPPVVTSVNPQKTVPRVTGVKRSLEDEGHFKPNTAVTYTPTVPRTSAPGSYQVYPFSNVPSSAYPPHLMPGGRPANRF